MKTVTIDEVLSWRPCENYDKKRLKKLAGRRRKMSGLQILALKIPVADRFWAILKHGFLSDKDLRLFACDCAEHVLWVWEKKFPEDKRIRDCIAVARRFANGDAPKEELAAAQEAAKAAWAAEAAWAAKAAAWAAAQAAWEAARAEAAWAAWVAEATAEEEEAAEEEARAKEWKWQVRRLRKYLEKS